MRREHLMQEVIANPCDDEPRLIFADWLEEQGDPQAEFIRLQIQRANLPIGSPLAPELVFREEALFREHGTHWAGPLAKLSAHCRYVRGFVEEVSLGLRAVLSHLGDILRSAPIRNLGIDRADERVEQIADQLAEHPQTELHTIRFSNPQFSDEAFAGLLSQPALQRLTTIGMKQAQFPTDVCHTIANSVPTLNALFLSGVTDSEQFSADALDGFRQLRFLSLKDINCEPEELANLARLDLPDLRALSVHRLSFEAIARQFLDNRSMPRLRWLDFGSASDFDETSVEGGRTIERLALPGNRMTDRQLQTLINSPGMAGLRYLDLRYSRLLTQRSVTTLVQSQPFPHLDCLRFSISNNLSFAAVEQLASAWAQRPRAPGRLCLSFHGLSNGERRRLHERYGRMNFNDLEIGVEVYDITQLSSNLVQPEEHLSEIITAWDDSRSSIRSRAS